MGTRMKDRAWGDHWDEAIGESRELNPHIPKPDPPKEEEKEEKKEEAEEKKSDDKKEEDKEKGDKDEKKKKKRKKKKKLSKMNDSLLLKIISKKNLLHTTHPKKHNLKKNKVFCTHILTSPNKLRMRWFTRVLG